MNMIRSGRRRTVLVAAAVCVMMLFTQVFCYAAYNTVPTKMYPSMVDVEIVRDAVHQTTGKTHQMEMHIKFSNNVSAIDEEQVREAVNAPADTNPDYMKGVNERNLTQFHLIEKESGEEVDSSNWTVEPHPNAKKQTDESKYFYIYADNLDENKDYQVKVDEDLYANMGNSLGVSYTIDFNLAADTCTFSPDGELPEDEHVQAPLTLDLINIENGEKDVPVDQSILMRFSYNVSGPEKFTFNASKISLAKEEDESKTVEIDVQPGGEVQEIIVKPKENLKEGTGYVLIIEKELEARNGITLSSPLKIYFTTAGEADTDNPGGSGGEGGSGSGGSGGGGSSGEDTDEPEEQLGNLTIAAMKNGSVTIDPEKPEAGDKVRMTVTPDEGYLLKSIRVTDENGNEIELTEGPNGKYNFIMPEGEVTLEAVFEEDEPIENYYTDIESSWAAEDINLLADMGIVTGNPDGTFRPDNQITRAEIVTILVRMYDLDSDNMMIFDDTKDHWANGYISIAAALGYVNGFDAQHFGPDEQLTREQMAVMVARIAELKEDTSGSNPLSFSDKDGISSWALNAVTAVFQNGVISGYPDGTFRPTAEITRAEACHMIVNLMNLQQEAA